MRLNPRKNIAKSFEVTPEWVSECVSPILAEKRMSRDVFIYKMSLLGWTQGEIGEVVGLDQSVVSRIMQEFNKFNLSIKSDFYEKHKSAEEIATDKASLFRQWLKKQKAGWDALNAGLEMKLRAEKNLGEMLKEQIKWGGDRKSSLHNAILKLS